MVPQARAQDCRHPANAFEELIGRRSSSRHAIDLCARYVTPEASVRVKLEDISASGAAFRMMVPRPLRSGRLNWLGFEIFGEIAWQCDTRCGLRFGDRLSAECLRRTLDFGERAAAGDGDRFARLASAWAYGPGDW
ncbi:PilZ domain-containing protein [Tsuneonella troitsensis]|uniref:PilZ domain-containing protein n=1 Tax=Tsuneonella troitsensis TaxID=292222 RepID=UPI00070C9AF9|nr:PilZ domain-containing protein [Tsuneonella troitsensis]